MGSAYRTPPDAIGVRRPGKAPTQEHTTAPQLARLHALDHATVAAVASRPRCPASRQRHPERHGRGKLSIRPVQSHETIATRMDSIIGAAFGQQHLCSMLRSTLQHQVPSSSTMRSMKRLTRGSRRRLVGYIVTMLASSNSSSGRTCWSRPAARSPATRKSGRNAMPSPETAASRMASPLSSLKRLRPCALTQAPSSSRTSQLCLRLRLPRIKQS
jgi:hypothetical protein